MPSHRYCHHGQASKTQAFVEKLYFVTSNGNHPDTTGRNGRAVSSSDIIDAKIDQLQKDDKLIQSVVSDGGMKGVGYVAYERGTIHNIFYSMNKKKRWELPEMLENAIVDEAFEDIGIDSDTHVTCMLRRSQVHTPAKEETASVVRISSTSFHNHKTVKPKRKNGCSYLTDLVEKELRSSPNVAELSDSETDEEDAEEHVSPYNQARNKDLGILYHFSVSNPIKKKCDTWKEKQRTNQRNTSRSLNEDISEAVLSRHIPWLSDCGSEEAQEDWAVGESGISHAFEVDMAELLDNIPLKHKVHHRRRKATGSSTSSDSAIFDRQMMHIENTEAGEGMSIPVSKESLPPATFVASDSQRTFFFPRIDITDVDAVVSATAALVAPDPFYRVAFFDVGLDVAVVAVFQATVFGIQCSVKGPESFLERMPEFMSVDELLDRFEREAHLTGRKESCLYEKAKDTFSPSHHSVSMYNLTVGSLLRSDEGPVTLKDGTCFLCGSSGVIVNGCGHSACDFCWIHYMAAKVSDGITRFTCMEKDCKSLISANLIGFLGPWGILEPWQSRNLDLIVSSSSGFHCPTQRCHHAVLTENEADKASLAQSLVLCSGCSKGLCLLCKENWHWPCPCKEAETYHNVMASMDDDPFNRYGKVKLRYFANTKKCPGCKLIMEKGEGCNNMSCNCGMQFCWFCGQPQEKHYGPGGTYRGCAGEQQLDKIDVERTTDLRWKDAVYQKAVELRKKRFQLRKNKKLDEDVKVALFTAYHILEYGFAYESQMAGVGLRLSNRIKAEMDNFRFVLGLLEDHVADGQERKAKIYAEKVMNSLAKLRSAFQANEKH